LLPASTDRIPASSDPNHLPLIVLVRIRVKEVGQRMPAPTGFFAGQVW
jgi:hypothetical protein